MSKKTLTTFCCQSCGAQFPRWLGRCTECGTWNTVQEEIQAPKIGFAKSSSASKSAFEVSSLAASDLGDIHRQRLLTHISEYDRVLGGGLVPGSLVLMSGDPGIGKSTLLLQAVHGYAKQGHKVLYISGEESTQQIGLRARRLGLMHENIHVVNEISLATILAGLDGAEAKVVVVDSIQTLASEELSSAPGSVSQVRECAARLLEWSKGKNVPVVLVGHVTKDGSIAGPRVLEHLVDAVLFLEGEKTTGLRLLRAVKNRFGSTGEVGMFEMSAAGLSCVMDPSAYLLQNHSSGKKSPAGVAASVSMEGTRPLLVEVQALTAKTHFGMPRRVVSGWDSNRLAILLAVLERHGGLHFGVQDVFTTVAGGLEVSEPAVDLAFAAAAASSLLDRPLPERCIFLGEVTLTGEVRPVTFLAARLQEAQRIGFARVVVASPFGKNKGDEIPKGLEVMHVASILDLLKIVR